MVCNVISRLNVGGPAIHTILLTSRLHRDRYRSILVKGTEAPAEGDMSALAKQEGVEPIVIEELGREVRPLDDLAAFAKLTKLLWRERPAIVHTHTAKAGALGRMASLVVNFAWAARRHMGLPAPPSIRSVHTYHGNVFHGYFSPLKTRLYLAIERALARFTDVVIVISPLQRSEIVETFKIAEPSRVRLIPLGLDLGPFRNCSNYRGKLRAELGLGETTRLIGTVGRLVPIKRHDLLLEAISLLKDSKVSGGGFCCVVVGDGELRSALERQAEEMGLSEYVRFLGWRRDLETVYADLDCLVLTSDNEGTPFSVIEALSAEVPVDEFEQEIQHSAFGTENPDENRTAVLDIGKKGIEAFLRHWQVVDGSDAVDEVKDLRTERQCVDVSLNKSSAITFGIDFLRDEDRVTEVHAYYESGPKLGSVE